MRAAGLSGQLHCRISQRLRIYIERFHLLAKATTYLILCLILLSTIASMEDERWAAISE